MAFRMGIANSKGFFINKPKVINIFYEINEKIKSKQIYKRFIEMFEKLG